LPREKARLADHAEELDDYLEAMTRSAFQSGISWDVITQVSGFQEVFKKFDVKHVANLTRGTSTSSCRTRASSATRQGRSDRPQAQAIIDTDAEFKGFRKYCVVRRLRGARQEMKKRFKFLGDSGAYIFLYTVKEKVPEYHEWRDAHR